MNNPLLEAARDEDLDRVRQLLLEPGVYLEAMDSIRCTSLHYAARDKFGLILELLINAGANLEARDINGTTPLNAASHIYENTSNLERLVRAGADIQTKDDGGWTPLHHSIFYGYESAVRLLLENGADYMAITNSGRSMKELAELVRNSKSGIVKLLEEYENTPDVKEPAYD